jgi:hypothetical protein
MHKPDGLTDVEWDAFVRRSLECPYIRAVVDLTRNGRTYESAITEVALLLSRARDELIKVATDLSVSKSIQLIVTADDSTRRGAGEDAT